MRAAGEQRGSAVVLVCALGALVGALALGLGHLGQVAAARARAETAADAAALAAAGELAAGRSPQVTTRTARVMAAANGARLIRCNCRDQSATVTVTVAASKVSSFFREARAEARAELHTQCPG